MGWIKRLASSLRGRKLEENLEKEIAFHLEMRNHEKTSAGVTAEEARRQVLHRFGSLTRIKEGCRDQSTFALVAALRQDLRYAARNMRRHPGFTAAAVACLAVGIGANTAVFSFVNAFFFQPIPPNVVMVQHVSGTGTPVSYSEYRDWQRLNQVFDDVFAYTPGERLTIGRSGDDAEQSLGETVTANYFQTLGVVPAAGRLFAPGDESLPLAVISYEFWHKRFSGDPAVAGKTIWINREAFRIAGVAPPTFQGMLAPWSTEVWVTPYLHRDREADRRNGMGMMVGARLKGGVTAPEAEAAMNSLDAELARQYPDSQRNPHDPLTVRRRSGLSGSPSWVVFIAVSVLLMIVVSIIFLIACANVAGLLIARALGRRRELLIRLSLGASRSRLTRQLLTESLLLGLMGAAAGVAMAYASGDRLADLFPQSISGGFRFQHGIDAHVLAYTLMLSLASVLLAGLLPALRASNQDLAAAAKTHTATGMRTPRLRRGLVVAQVAASVLVLAAAGTFIRTFQKEAYATDPGLDASHLLTVTLDLREMKYPPLLNEEFYREVGRRVGAAPGVESVSFADVLPLGNQRVVTIPDVGEIATATVDSNYFRTVGIPLLRGREPGASESNVVIVNEALAHRLWPNQDPIGKSVRLGPTLSFAEVVGLTATGKYWSLAEFPRPFLYQISRQWSEPSLSLAIRTEGPPQRLAGRLAKQIQELNRDLPAISVETEEQRLRVWLEPERAGAVLMSILGLTALGLAVTGLYALLAQLVTERTPEIAVRVTLGATRVAVAGMVLRQSAFLVVTGTAAGIATSAAVARLLASVAGQVNPLDGITLIGVAALLAAVGAAATLVPTHRALRIDPISALRAE